MNVIRFIAVIVAILIGVTIWQSMQNHPVPTSQPAPTTMPYQPLSHLMHEDVPLPDPAPPWYGMAIQVHRHSGALDYYKPLLQEIANLGADTVLLSIDGFQKHVESTNIATNPDKCPSDQDWIRLFDFAHQLNMRVILMPKVLLSDPRGKNWRGKIEPNSWDDWFNSYTKFIVHFAQLAQFGEVEVLIVGSELISTERHTEKWRNVIAETREVYSGQLAYSANWDHYRNIQFWNDLDIIGMTSYHKLADEPGATAEEIVENWAPIHDRIMQWALEQDRPLLFTEAGWCSQEGCAVQAWNYYRQRRATEEGRAEQKACYRAFIETWVDEPSLAGIIWWEWTSSGGSDDVGYCPKGKPAEDVLRKFFKKVSSQENQQETTE